MKRLLIVVCASLFVPLLADADPQTADEWYKEGENQYNLGNFEKAADAFKQGYSLETVESKKAVYLYNVAQAYRQANKCKDAEFFYKRFLALKDADTAKPLKPQTRAEIEQWIAQLEECVKQQEAIAKRPPDGVAHPDDGTTVGKTGTGTGAGLGSGSAAPAGAGKVATSEGSGEEDDEGQNNVTKHMTGSAKLLSARLTGGITKISAGDVSVPVEPEFALFAGYPLQLAPKLELDVGGLFSFTPVPFVNTMTQAKSTASFTSIYADAGVVYTVAPKIDVRGDLGLGLLMFGGISDMGNPFTQDGAPTTGSLAMFAVRIAASGEYEVAPNILVTATPAFAFSPAKSGLRSDIKSITHVDFMVGVGYRM